MKRIYLILFALFCICNSAFAESYIQCDWIDTVVYSKYNRAGEQVPKSAIFKLNNNHLYNQDGFDLGEVGNGDILSTKYSYKDGIMTILEEIVINRKTSEIIKTMYISDEKNRVYYKLNGIGKCKPTTNTRKF